MLTYGVQYIRCDRCGVSRPPEAVKQVEISEDGQTVEVLKVCVDKSWCAGVQNEAK